MLNAEGVATASLHGGRTQGEREAALRDFTRGLCSVLVSPPARAQHPEKIRRQRRSTRHQHGSAEKFRRLRPQNRSYRAKWHDRSCHVVLHRLGRLHHLSNQARFTRARKRRSAFTAFATGKEARAREKEAQRAWKEERSADQSKKETDSGGIISVDDKFKSMLVTKRERERESIDCCRRPLGIGRRRLLRERERQRKEKERERERRNGEENVE